LFTDAPFGIRVSVEYQAVPDSTNTIIGWMSYQYTVTTTALGGITFTTFINIGQVFENSPIRIQVLDASGNVVEAFGAVSPNDTSNPNAILAFDPSFFSSKVLP
jgi:hypothetical protein